MLDTFERIYKQVHARCPAAGLLMAQDFVRWSFREVIEKRKWSWAIKQSQFIFPALVNAGTCDVTANSNAVVGHGTAWNATMIGLQFRTSTLTPIYTITAVPSATSLTLDQPWGFLTSLGTGYKIYLAYVVVPLDFHAFTTVWDPNFSWQLWTTIRQDELNMYDAQRASQGTPYVVADYDYTALAIGGGAISPPIPRYEVWPHLQQAYVIPFMYESRYPDLDDAGAALPRYIPGDVLLEGALAQMARWPGTDRDHPSPYFNLGLATMHGTIFDKKVRELERQDDEVYSRDVWYESGPVWPMCPYPFPINSSYLQLHAI